MKERQIRKIKERHRLFGFSTNNTSLNLQVYIAPVTEVPHSDVMDTWCFNLHRKWEVEASYDVGIDRRVFELQSGEKSGGSHVC